MMPPFLPCNTGAAIAISADDGSVGAAAESSGGGSGTAQVTEYPFSYVNVTYEQETSSTDEDALEEY